MQTQMHQQLASIRIALFGLPPKPVRISRATKERVRIVVTPNTSSAVRCNSVTVRI